MRIIIINEIRENMKYNKIIFYICIVIFILGNLLCTVLLSFNFYSYNNYLADKSHYSSVYENNSTSIGKVINSRYNYNNLKLKELHKQLNSAKNFDYLSIFKMNGKSTSNIFNNRNSSENNVDILFLDQKSFSEFNLKTNTNRYFSSQDYTLTYNGDFPVILGYNFKDRININDTFYLDSFFQKGNATVIGFLDNNSNIFANGRNICTDDYIIVPSFNSSVLPENYEQEVIQYALYDMKCNGTVIPKTDFIKSQQELQNICNELYIFPSYNISGVINEQTYKLLMSVPQFTSLVMILFLLSTLIVFLTLTTSMILKLKSNLKRYAILASCGYSKKHIYIIILGELFFFFLISILICTPFIILTFSTLNIPLYVYLIYLLFNIAIFCIISYILTLILKKSDLSVYLRSR